MKDNELRAIVLKQIYDLRRLGNFQWDAKRLEEIFAFPDLDMNEFSRICDQLAEHNLIKWDSTKLRIGVVGGISKITVFGVDVVEGTAQAPISISFDQRTITVTGSNNIVGNNNQLSLEKIDFEISQSNFSENEKAEAKSLWQKVSDNKLLNTVIGSVVGAATKHALETAQPK